MKVRIKVRPTGYVSFDGGPLAEWPAVGAVVNLPEVVAQDLIDAGRAEKVVMAKAEPVGEKVETRPAPTGNEEQRRRPGRPPANKQDD